VLSYGRVEGVSTVEAPRKEALVNEAKRKRRKDETKDGRAGAHLVYLLPPELQVRK